MIILLEIVLVLRDLLVALGDVVLGQKRRRWVTEIEVPAPRTLVWDMLVAPDVTYDGLAPMRMKTRRLPGSQGLLQIEISTAGRVFEMRTRLLDERVGRAWIAEIMPDGSSPEVCEGGDDRLGIELTETAGGTLLHIWREVTPKSLLTRLRLPFSLRMGARRYKRKAAHLAAGGEMVVEPRVEAPAATPTPATATAVPSVPAAAVPGAPAPAAANVAATPAVEVPQKSSLPAMLGWSMVAVGTFTWLWGFEFAVLVAVIIIIHEAGHALAMWLVGIRIKGITLVPFFGGAAIPAEPIRRESQNGFIALMGPGFSIVSTLAFYWAAKHTGRPILAKAALASAIINLLNLAPVLPFDGGQVTKAVLVSFSRTVAQIVGLAGAAAGLWFAWVTRDIVIAIVAGLGLLLALGIRADESVTPMRWPGALALLAAYAATILTYLAILRYL